LSFFTIYFITA